MNEYILREAALQAQNKSMNLAECRKRLERISAADVRPAVHGKWIRHPEQKNIYGGKLIECSVCGTQYLVMNIEYELFCRNCGADMRGTDDA